MTCQEPLTTSREQIALVRRITRHVAMHAGASVVLARSLSPLPPTMPIS